MGTMSIRDLTLGHFVCPEVAKLQLLSSVDAVLAESRPSRSLCSDGSEHDGIALAAAAAQGSCADAATATTQLVQQCQCEAVAAHADWVAEGDRAAVDVDDLVGDAEFVD